MKALISEKIYHDYFQSLIHGDKYKCRAVVTDLFDKNIEIKNLYENLYQRSLYQVGKLWENNEISVATEHLATSITSGLMTLSYPVIFNSEKNGKRVIVAATANEFHEIGSRMVADLLEMNGWDSYFLGANTPLEDLLKLIEEKQPDLLAFSVAVYFNLKELKRIISTIVRAYPSLSIVVGGQAFNWGGEELLQKHKNIRIFKNLIDFETFIENF